VITKAHREDREEHEGKTVKKTSPSFLPEKRKEEKALLHGFPFTFFTSSR
jgi:hypothetical protein